MRRLRFAMLGLTIALFVPVALLIALALNSVALEEATQHRALAERAFDEMERALSRFLEQEEARPIDHYAYFLGGRDDSDRRRSPLSQLSEDPFLIGHFQIDPHGALTTPLQRPDTPGQDPDEDTRAAIARLAQLVPRALADARARPAMAQKKTSAPASDFGSTLTLEQPPTPVTRLTSRLDGLLRGKSIDSDASLESTGGDSATPQAHPEATLAAGAAREGESLGWNEALESLNVGQKLREQRKSRYTAAASEADDRAESPSRQVAAAGTPPAPRALAKSDEALQADSDSAASTLGVRAAVEAHETTDAARQRGDSATAVPRPMPQDMRQGASVGKRETKDAENGAAFEELAGASFPARAPAPTPPSQPSDAQVARERIEVDPMVGMVAGPHHLVLARTVLIGRQGYRQGLLIDRRRLGQWLREQVIVGRLAELSELRFGEATESSGSSSSADESYRYRHHFAEPFDAVQATLALEPLAGSASTRNIYALSGLLALITAGGLLAVYRMIAVVVRYAERRSAFVSAVSHELKTPLTAIRMYGEMLRDGLVRSEDKRHEYYRTIHDESERLGRLINNVLEFSQLERGQRELNLVAGSVAEVVREVVSNLGPHAERQGFSLSARIDDDLPAVRFDRDALVQVLFNLTDNAMKYARGVGPQRVEISCYRADERGRRSQQGQRVMLEVRDFGPGVARRHLSHVFEPFYRASASSEIAQGTGIGLALVRDLCEAMGAAVSAANVEQGGFRVLVDFHSAAA